MSLDALILGGGPAGCACALWLKQLELEVALIERAERLGGLQTTSPYPNTWIPGMIGKTGIDLARDMERHLKLVGVPLLTGCEPTRIRPSADGFAIDIDRRSEPTIEAAHLVVATGVEPIDGGFVASPDVLIGPGAAIDGHDFRGKSVAILGGGDNAAENFGFIAAKSPARMVLFARHVTARPPLLRRVPVEARRIGPYEVDIDHRTVIENGKSERFDVLVVLYGWQARIPAPVLELGPVRDARGFLATDAERRTSIPRMWAIGEVTQALHPCCITSMSDGVTAAKGIERERRESSEGL